MANVEIRVEITRAVNGYFVRTVTEHDNERRVYKTLAGVKGYLTREFGVDEMNRTETEESAQEYAPLYERPGSDPYNPVR
jgi:hypothetical protein